VSATVSAVTGQATSAGASRAPAAVARIRGVLGVMPLLSRIVAAIGGGYALAALLSVAVLALPVSRPQAVIGGMLGSFAVYAGAVVWVFAVRSATRAWVGLIIAALPLLPFAWSVWTAAAPAASP
jgi:hypothetical protein